MDPLRPLRVLVVDDDPDTVESTVMLLRLRGFAAAGVVGGDGVPRAATDDPPDVVLIDLAMPGIDGLEVARRVRAAAAGDPPVLVAMTGYGSDADRSVSAGAGFDVHLLKPVPPAALFDLLDRLAREPEWALRRTLGHLRWLGDAVARRTQESLARVAQSREAVAAARRLLHAAAAWPPSRRGRTHSPAA